MLHLPKFLKVVCLGLSVLFIAMQFVRPVRTNPISDAALALQAPAEINAIFERACNDCHSNATRWPWYSHVAPVSWLISEDVRVGRAQLNFSEWGSLTPRQAEHKLEEISVVVRQRVMPPRAYTLSHPSAKLSASDIQVVSDWVEAEKRRLLARQ